ncbi:MAG: cytochrome B [Gammaproteobacteria bacterium]|nr:cytochrome B [Gammaproteobacteria bacterium]
MERKVWDLLVRIFHWCSAVIFFVNYWILEDGQWHEWLGYGLAFLLCVRFFWGFVGTRHARFSDFFPTPRRLKSYLSGVSRNQESETVEHNPVGSLMVLTLMFSLMGLVMTGWFMELDVFWGVGWPEEVHELLANWIMFLVGIHVAVVLFYDLVLKRGLIRAMVTGCKNSV